MKTTFYSICLLSAALLLVACSPLAPSAIPQGGAGATPQGGADATPQGGADATRTAYPAPGVVVQPGGSPTETGPGAYPVLVPNGDLLAAFIEGSSLGFNKSNPPQAVLTLSGNLPTPCHTLGFTVAPPDKDNQVQVKLTIREPDPPRMCTQVLTPFSQEVPLGLSGLPAGKYRVLVNGSLVGEISLP